MKLFLIWRSKFTTWMCKTWDDHSAAEKKLNWKQWFGPKLSPWLQNVRKCLTVSPTYHHPQFNRMYATFWMYPNSTSQFPYLHHRALSQSNHKYLVTCVRNLYSEVTGGQKIALKNPHYSCLIQKRDEEHCKGIPKTKRKFFQATAWWALRGGGLLGLDTSFHSHLSTLYLYKSPYTKVWPISLQN